jgi:hypothetical protein
MIWYNDKPAHIIIVSMIVFLILNFIENLIYYNNGKYGFGEEVSTYFIIPEKKNLFFIIIIMFSFAFAQGLLTMLLSKFY